MEENYRRQINNTQQYILHRRAILLRVIHLFFCRWTVSVLFFLICLFWHVNGAADGLAFWTDRREERGYWVYCVPSTKEWRSPLSQLTSLCRSFPCFLFSLILPTQFLCLIICFRLPGCAFGEIHLDSFPFSCLLKHLPNNWPAAAREIAASTWMNFDLLAKAMATKKYKCKTPYCKHKQNIPDFRTWLSKAWSELVYVYKSRTCVQKHICMQK